MNLPSTCRAFALYFLFGLTTVSTVVAGAEEAAFPTRFEWGKLVATDTTVELHIASAPKNRVVAVPRFNNPYRKVYLKRDASQKPLKFSPQVNEWRVTLPADTEAAALVVIETVGKPQLLGGPFVSTATEEGEFVLPAHHAIVHGEKLRYEPQPHKNTVGYWTVEKDWCEWKLNVAQPGKFAVHILQGCGKGHGGSKVEIKVGESRVVFTVEDTGHFQNFKQRELGVLEISDSGEQALEIRPLSKAKVAVMDVRQVRLVPVK